MTEVSQARTSTRWALPFLAALIAALAAILLGTTASASAAGVGQTRVGAFNVVGEVLVGPPEHITAGQRLGEAAPQADFVVATGVAAKNAPTVTFSRSRAPGIAQNFDNAVANGSPTSLTRVGDATRKANRRAALRGQSRAPAGQSLDEYPFACSAQGGCGSFVRSVPVGEQNYQGGVLSRFFQDYGVNPGDPFNVLFGP